MSLRHGPEPAAQYPSDKSGRFYCNQRNNSHLPFVRPLKNKKAAFSESGSSQLPHYAAVTSLPYAGCQPGRLSRSGSNGLISAPTGHPHNILSSYIVAALLRCVNPTHETAQGNRMKQDISFPRRLVLDLIGGGNPVF